MTCHICTNEKPYPDADCQWCGDKGTFQFYDENDELQEMDCFECRQQEETE